MDIKKYLMILTAVVCFGISAIAQGKTYQVGDLYDENGVKGFVIKVPSEGKHGLIMSLSLSTKTAWCKDKTAIFETEAFWEDDGEKNMQAIARYINDNGKSWNNFPAFAWARSNGDGWYIPSKEEVEIIITAMNGGLGKVNTTYFKKNFKKKFKKAGGKKAAVQGNLIEIWSSTEAEGGKVYSTEFHQNYVEKRTGQDGRIGMDKFDKKEGKTVRAIRKF